MVEKISNESEPVKSEKEEQWQGVEDSLKQELGPDFYYIEPRIKEPVIALNASGVNTTNSCEGHHNHGRIVPWVSFGADSQPLQRYVDQKEFEQKVREKNGISQDLYQRSIDQIKEFNRFKDEMLKTRISETKLVFDEKDDKESAEMNGALMKKYSLSHEDIEKIVQVDAYVVPKEVEKAAQQKILTQETEEYIRWHQEDQAELNKVYALLEEFEKYKKQNKIQSPKNVKLIVSDELYSHFIRNEGGGDYVNLGRKMTPKEKRDYEDILEGKVPKEKQEELKTRIKQYRKEFQEFAEFLKRKFFE